MSSCAVTGCLGEETDPTSLVSFQAAVGSDEGPPPLQAQQPQLPQLLPPGLVYLYTALRPAVPTDLYIILSIKTKYQ